jgi:hypothetical protein
VGVKFMFWRISRFFNFTGIDGVNIVFNYSLDSGQNVFATHYINRISNLDKYAGLFAISFVTIKTLGVLEPIIYLLKRMNQVS